MSGLQLRTSGGGTKSYLNIVHEGAWKRFVGWLDAGVCLHLSDAYLHFKTRKVHHESNPVTAHLMLSAAVTKVSLSHCLELHCLMPVANSHRWVFKFK